MGEGCNLRDKLDVMLCHPARQVGHLFLLKKSAVASVLMGRILLDVMEWIWGIVAAAVIAVAGKFDPSGIEFGMAIEPHAGSNFHDQGVVLVERHVIADEAPKILDILASREEQIDAAKRLIRPVTNLDTANRYLAILPADELAKRLESPESSAIITARNQNEIFVAV